MADGEGYGSILEYTHFSGFTTERRCEVLKGPRYSDFVAGEVLLSMRFLTPNLSFVSTRKTS